MTVADYIISHFTLHLSFQSLSYPPWVSSLHRRLSRSAHPSFSNLATIAIPHHIPSPLASSDHTTNSSQRPVSRRISVFPSSRPLRPFHSALPQPTVPKVSPVKLIEPPKNSKAT